MLLLILPLFFVFCEVVIIVMLQWCNCSKLYVRVFILCHWLEDVDLCVICGVVNLTAN